MASEDDYKKLYEEAMRLLEEKDEDLIRTKETLETFRKMLLNSMQDHGKGVLIISILVLGQCAYFLIKSFYDL